MSDPIPHGDVDPQQRYDQFLTRLLAANVTDLERFVRCIDRRAIENLVRHTKYLQRHVFPGFRPDKLPWLQVPTKLARNAAGNHAAVSALLNLWLAEHSWLCERIEERVSLDTAEEDTARLLVTIGERRRELLFCALFLDGRAELQSILDSRLQKALLEGTPEFEALVLRLAQDVPTQDEQVGGDASAPDGIMPDATADIDAGELETRPSSVSSQVENETETGQLTSCIAEPTHYWEQASGRVADEGASGELARPFGVALARLDECWTTAVEAIARHVGLWETTAGVVAWTTPSEDRQADWKAWQEIEASLVSHVLGTTTPLDEDLQAYRRRVQKLLALRWYLLEAIGNAQSDGSFAADGDERYGGTGPQM